jgi:ATP phosphoribosyltransferase regulatory subunit
MIHQPPAGARDLLPLEVEQKCWINDQLQEVFQRWGYQRIVTSTIERLETLMAGGAIEGTTVIQLQDGREGRLGLRPELTASIARAAVTRMGSSTAQRLCYRANVFRNPPVGHHGRQLEFYQAGVELLFAGGVLADGEILLLLADCLQKLGLEQWQLVVGEASLTRSLLSPFPPNIREQVRHCLANLDRVGLENLPLSPELLDRALLVLDLRGKPADVLQKVASLELDVAGKEIVKSLKSLMELLAASSTQPFPLTLDLSLIQTFDYYTGIVFDAVGFKNNQPQILGQGGRYDRLLGLYDPQGKSAPGIGFSLNIEDLYHCLLETSPLPQKAPATDWLVIPATASAATAAFAYAANLRQSKHLVRVEIELGEKTRGEILDYARNRRISRLAWVDVEGIPTIESV